jgi:threonine dehydratase
LTTPTTRTAPTLRDIEAAAARLEGIVQRTPIHYSETLSRRAGREVLLKAENLQRTGAFKIRGAANKIRALRKEERAAGVAAASAGNHGQAVAWAAREAGVPATVFMPLDAPMAKIDATKSYGARVELVGEAFEDSLSAAQAFVEESGATFVHSFDDELVIAGQGTIGLELAEQLPDDATVLVPVGGGGLAAGVALALAELRPRMRVLGVQAATCAPFAGEGPFGFTIADGIAVKRPGELTAPILRELLDGVVTASDDEISSAILLLLERTKLVVEGAGAVGLAALLAGRVDGDGRVCVLLSGGNIDASLLVTVIRHGLTRAGRYLVVRSRLPDRPGELLKLLGLVAQERVNVVSVEHHREGMAIAVGETEVELTLATRDEDHCATLLATMQRWGYPVQRVR